MENDIKSMIKQAIITHAQQSISDDKTIFDLIQEQIYRYTSQPVHSISEAKKYNTTKVKGDLWETFCCLWLQAQNKYATIWRLRDVPPDIKQTLNLTNNDMGIDLIAVDEKHHYYAIQCKYKSPYGKGIVPGTLRLRRNYVNWNELCTFIVLCQRSGPYKQHIVMTSCVGVRRVGRRQKQDRSICRAAFRKTTLEQWYTMAGMESNTSEQAAASSSTSVPQDINELRTRRLARFSQPM